ncbi:unnamed protein product [Arctogadus glacialis]
MQAAGVHLVIARASSARMNQRRAGRLTHFDVFPVFHSGLHYSGSRTHASSLIGGDCGRKARRRGTCCTADEYSRLGWLNVGLNYDGKGFTKGGFEFNTSFRVVDNLDTERQG